MTVAKRSKALAERKQEVRLTVRTTTGTVDVTDAMATLPEKQRSDIADAMIALNNRNPPQVTLEQTERGFSYGMKGESEATRTLAHVQLLNALGTGSTAFVDTALASLIQLWEANGGATEKQYNAALAVLNSEQPKTELEAMLLVQMIAANESAMRCAAMIGKSDMFNQAQGFGNLTNKFMRTFSAQAEALTKLRRGGEQVVRHVYVQEGGQAVFAGTINQNKGGGENAEVDGQPFGAFPIAHGPPLPGQNAEGDGMSVSSDAKRAVSHPRREKSGSPEGKPKRVQARPKVG